MCPKISYSPQYFSRNHFCAISKSSVLLGVDQLCWSTSNKICCWFLVLHKPGYSLSCLKICYSSQYFPRNQFCAISKHSGSTGGRSISSKIRCWFLVHKSWCSLSCALNSAVHPNIFLEIIFCAIAKHSGSTEVDQLCRSTSSAVILSTLRIVESNKSKNIFTCFF